MAAPPIEQRLNRRGEEMEIIAALNTLLCSGCGKPAGEAKQLMLCKAGCRRQRS